jgi:Resolvase, N terminal domain
MVPMGRMMKPLVAYMRVSTSRQGRSGLGIEAQREALARFAADERFEIAAEIVEVESGKGSDALDRRSQLRPALAKARSLRCPVAAPSSTGFRATSSGATAVELARGSLAPKRRHSRGLRRRGRFAEQCVRTLLGLRVERLRSSTPRQCSTAPARAADCRGRARSEFRE